MAEPRASSFSKPRLATSYAGQCRSALRKKKLIPASKAAQAVSSELTMPRQNGLTRRSEWPRASRSLNLGSFVRGGFKADVELVQRAGLAGDVCAFLSVITWVE